MGKNFNLTIVTPEKIAYQGAAMSLVAPCENGYLGVLADHAPLAANTKDGKITIKEPSGAKVSFLCRGTGFLEVLKNNVSIVVDFIKDS